MFWNKKAQEEMVGFAVVILLVMIILVVFLAIALSNRDDNIGVESFEVSSFSQSILEYTTDCAENYEPNYLNVRELIFECSSNGKCLDGRNSCDVLEESVSSLLESGWNAGEDSLVKGYQINITSNDKEVLGISEGNITGNYKGAPQFFRRSGEDVFINLEVYY